MSVACPRLGDGGSAGCMNLGHRPEPALSVGEAYTLEGCGPATG